MMKSQWICRAVLAATTVAMTGVCVQAQSPTDAKDKVFLKKSAEGSMSEVAMGKIALQKSNNDDVKNFAQKMVTDHTQLLEDMKPVAEKLGVQPPAAPPKEKQMMADRMSKLDGDAFDKAYIEAMVADHHKDLREFKMEEQSTQNDELKAKVASGAEVIKEHTMMIDEIAKKHGIATPSAPAM